MGAALALPIFSGTYFYFCKQILGRRVEETRRDLDISKVDFCVATGISRPYLDRIEGGTANFTLKVLFKIAPALGMTVSELLEGIE